MQASLRSNLYTSEETQSSQYGNFQVNQLTKSTTDPKLITIGNFALESQVNEAIHPNTRKLIGLSQKKKYFPPNFFTKPQTKDRAATIYRISYGEDTITRACESDYKGVMIKTKTFIPPEYRDFQGSLNQLPTFLKEKLYEEADIKRPTKVSGTPIAFSMSSENNINSERYNGVHVKMENLPSISPSVQRAFTFGGSMRDTRYKLGATDGFRRTEVNDFPYLSPKARQQMKSESVPILMSNVFLTGMINPDGINAQAEATIEHIISEHHAKLRPKDELFGKVETPHLDSRQSKMKLDKITVAQTLALQDKKKKNLESSPDRRTQKNNMDRIGMKLKATVGHLRMERETRRKKILDLMKTKNFNLFRPNTINNLHLLKDALLNE